MTVGRPSTWQHSALSACPVFNHNNSSPVLHHSWDLHTQWNVCNYQTFCGVIQSLIPHYLSFLSFVATDTHISLFNRHCFIHLLLEPPLSTGCSSITNRFIAPFSLHSWHWVKLKFSASSAISLFIWAWKQKSPLAHILLPFCAFYLNILERQNRFQATQLQLRLTELSFKLCPPLHAVEWTKSISLSCLCCQNCPASVSNSPICPRLFPLTVEAILGQVCASLQTHTHCFY